MEVSLTQSLSSPAFDAVYHTGAITRSPAKRLSDRSLPGGPMLECLKLCWMS